jgi:hypothetical protein
MRSKRPKLIKSETKKKMGDNTKHQGNPGNHQGLHGKPIFKLIAKS